VADASLQILAQVSAALLLGAYFGLERRLRGCPDASLFHAAIAGAGLVFMVATRPQASIQITIMVIVTALTFVSVLSIRMLLRWCAGRRDIFATSGSDTFSITGAICVGCACGTGNLRAVAGVMVVMVLIAMLRPLQRFNGLQLARGDVDAPYDAAMPVIVPFPANDSAVLKSLDDPEGPRYGDP
jgi:uncharacterized membrane protein YhiD involved in acid resistance